MPRTSVAVIAQYPQNTFYAMWYLDGNLHYCHHPHIYFTFSWRPLLLLCSCGFPTHSCFYSYSLWWVSHLRPLKWINRLAPVYDAYISPLKDKHWYWFRAILLIRGILLVLLTITSVDSPELNVFALFLFTIFIHVCQLRPQLNGFESSRKCYLTEPEFWSYVQMGICILNQGQHCLLCQLESPLLNSVSLLCGVWSSLVSVLRCRRNQSYMMSSLMTSSMMTSLTSELKILNLNHWSIIHLSLLLWQLLPNIQQQPPKAPTNTIIIIIIILL